MAQVEGLSFEFRLIPKRPEDEAAKQAHEYVQGLRPGETLDVERLLNGEFRLVLTKHVK